MFIGKAYNGLYAFLDWHENISRLLCEDHDNRKILVITDSKNIIETEFNDCTFHKVDSIETPDDVKYNKFKYIADALDEDDQNIMFV